MSQPFPEPTAEDLARDAQDDLDMIDFHYEESVPSILREIGRGWIRRGVAAERQCGNLMQCHDGACHDAAEFREQRDKLQAFKDFVNRRLDEAGIPDGPHTAEGCRIGDRLDMVFAQRDALMAACRISGAAARLIEAAINKLIEAAINKCEPGGRP